MKKLVVILSVCLLALAAFELRAQAQTPSIPKLTSAQYESMKKDDIYVIMFSQDGCSPCLLAKKTIMPALAEKYASEVNVHVYLFPTDSDVPAPDGTHLNEHLGINSTPTFVVLYNGTPELSEVGYASSKRADLEKKIDSAVSRRK